MATQKPSGVRNKQEAKTSAHGTYVSIASSAALTVAASALKAIEAVVDWRKVRVKVPDVASQLICCTSSRASTGSTVRGSLPVGHVRSEHS